MAVKATNVQELFAQLFGQSGSSFAFPLLTKGHAPSGKKSFDDPQSLVWHQDISNWFWYYNDFLQDADLTDEAFTIYDQSASGAPTKGVKLDATGGQYQLKLAATDEAEDLAWTMNGNLQIDSAKPFVLQVRFQVVHTMAANERIVIGLGSDYVQNLDNITRNIWFRLEADFDLLTERDDNTTDTDDQDTGFNVVEDTWYEALIVRGYEGTLYYALKNNLGQGFQLLDTLDGTGLSGNVQPICAVQKDSGATTPELLLDVVAFAGARAV